MDDVKRKRIALVNELRAVADQLESDTCHGAVIVFVRPCDGAIVYRWFGNDPSMGCAVVVGLRAASNLVEQAIQARPRPDEGDDDGAN